MPRIDRLIARNLGLSRKEVTREFRLHAFTDGRGGPLEDPRLPMPPSALPTEIAWRGQRVTLYDEFALLQHKPLGVVTAMRDLRHRTAYDCLPADLPLRADLRAVGRLDKETSGLLLWTTDGELLHRVTHPRYAIPRSYQAALAGEFASPPAGLTLDDGHQPNIVSLERCPPEALHPALARPATATVYASITITSGVFHEVRRIFAVLGTRVEALCRVSYGPFELPLELPPEGCCAVDLKAAFRGLHPRPDDAHPDDARVAAADASDIIPRE